MSSYLQLDHRLRAHLFGSGVDVRSGLVKGEGPRLDAAGLLNQMREAHFGLPQYSLEEARMIALSVDGVASMMEATAIGRPEHIAHFREIAARFERYASAGQAQRDQEVGDGDEGAEAGGPEGRQDEAERAARAGEPQAQAAGAVDRVTRAELWRGEGPL